ncbi:MAG TPA: lycopene cyclase domain-containing protein [Gammaproteobacteria bacterium]|nr:lycopene cyclase domain-containing protein [Gammaproteobacteria bacterium]
MWFAWSMMFMIPWTVFYIMLPMHRKAMLWASLYTMPFGLTEPIFVPEYWSPPSLFDLAITTGFDIESLVFCFGIGGVAVVLYNVVTGTSFEPVSEHYRRLPLHRHHRLAILSPFIAFAVFCFFSWNPIYSAFAAMLVGSIATILCRPDLKTKTWVGGVLFLLYYWLFVEGLEILSPGYVKAVWNLDALSGLVIFNTPLEELVFAFTFGMYWAGVYEHFNWVKTSKKH